MEAKERIDLAPVEPVDSIMQSSRGVDVVSYRQRIVNVRGPAFFFEHTQNYLLIPRRHAEALDDQSRQR